MKASSVKSEAVDGRMGGDTRGRCSVVIMLSLSRQLLLVMPEIDSGGGGSDSFIMCLGRHWGDTPHRPGVMMIHWMVNSNYGT